MQETKKKATKAAAKPKADKPKPEKKRAAPAAKKETKKAKKDPNAPKRGLSAFMYFSNAKRDEVLFHQTFRAVHDLLLHLGKVAEHLSTETGCPCQTYQPWHACNWLEYTSCIIADSKERTTAVGAIFAALMEHRGSLWNSILHVFSLASKGCMALVCRMDDMRW